MPYCPECGAEVFGSDAFCKSCGSSLLKGRRKPLGYPARGGSSSEERGKGGQPASGDHPRDEEPDGQVGDVYPALRMRRLRRAGSRRRVQDDRASDAAPGGRGEPGEADRAGEPGEPGAPHGVRASPSSDEQGVPTQRRPVDGLGSAAARGHSAGVPAPRLRREMSGLRHKAVVTGGKADHESGQWETEEDQDPDDREPASMASAREEIRRRYGGLDLPIEDGDEPSRSGQRRVDRARLPAPHRSELTHKELTERYEDDAVLSEMARGYSREYVGRDGWSPGALWDSLVYGVRLLRRQAGRPLAVRRLLRLRKQRERVSEDQLTELGEVALSARSLTTPLLDDYRDRLQEMQHELEMRQEEVDSLKERLEEAQRDRAAEERQLLATQEEIEARLHDNEDRLRPAEADYRTAIKKARAAEEDARSLSGQMDHARAELEKMDGSGEEAARLKAKIERWGAQRDGLLQEVPRLEARAAELDPEIDRLRRELERARKEARDHREQTGQREAEHRRRVGRMEGEIERIRVLIENLKTQRRALFLECGRQLDIDRPAHDHLEEIYLELDSTAADVRLIDQEIEIARAKPGPPDWTAITRAAVVLAGCFMLFILILLAAG